MKLPSVMVKLGGSLITDKRRQAHARREVIARLAREIAGAGADGYDHLVLGHGSGSFGHVAAARHGIGKGPLGREAVAGVAATQAEAARLHRMVIEALLAAGVPAWSWAPSSALSASAGQPIRGPMEPFFLALEHGLVPVTYGDVVPDREWGASICSTETALRYLVGRMQRRGHAIGKLLWLGETDGVYDRDGETVAEIDEDSLPRVLEMIGAPAGTDVTGGMLLRLETARALARLGIESWILNGTVPGLLAAVLAGEDVSGPGTGITRFRPQRPSR